MNNRGINAKDLTKRKRNRSSEDDMSDSDSSHQEMEDYSTQKEYKTKLSSFLEQQFAMNFKVLQADFTVLEEYEKIFFKDTSLDVMFIMDITGSMGMWLSEAKVQLSNIIEEITGNNPCSKIRMSFVGYRDFIDDINSTGQYASLDFTETIEEVTTFISKLSAYGGGDEPEDIAGALDIALKMNWQSSARYAVLVCDAPCHGNKYHNSIYDKYPNGDPKGLSIEALIEDFVKKSITLYCVEINNSTKKMLGIMSQVYLQHAGQEMNIESIGNAVNKFAFFVALSASATLGNITYNKVRLEDVVRKFREDTIEKIMKKYNQDLSEINDNLAGLLENMNLNESEQKMFNFISRMNSLNISQDTNELFNVIQSHKSSEDDYVMISLSNTGMTIIEEDLIDKSTFKLQVESEHFTASAICYSVYFVKNNNLISDWSNLMSLHKTINSELQIGKEAILSNNSYSIAIKDTLLDANGIGSFPLKIEKAKGNLSSFLSQNTQNAMLNQIADYFNLKQMELNPCQKNYICFRPHWLYELKSDFSFKFAEFEQTNVQGLKAEISKGIKESFSHFSYQITEGFLIVTDLIEEKGMIVSQSISTIKPPSYPIKGINEGYRGVMKFFVKHFCNDTCKKLGLVHPRKKEAKASDRFFYQDDTASLKICDLCTLPYNGKDAYCYQCTEHVNKSERKGKCELCNAQFEYFSYPFIKRKINPPTQCTFCRSSFAN